MNFGSGYVLRHVSDENQFCASAYGSEVAIGEVQRPRGIRGGQAGGGGPFCRAGALVLLAASILEGDFHLRAVGLDTSVLDMHIEIHNLGDSQVP